MMRIIEDPHPCRRERRKDGAPEAVEKDAEVVNHP